MKDKVYTIIVTKSKIIGKDQVKKVVGNLEYLVGYFGYTLECGNSWNKKINKKPKTIKSFITNLQKSYSEKEASCYDRTYVEIEDSSIKT
jgi:hypothetical protein